MVGRVVLGLLLCEDRRRECNEQGCNGDRLHGGGPFEGVGGEKEVGVAHEALHLAETVIFPTMPAW